MVTVIPASLGAFFFLRYFANFRWRLYARWLSRNSDTSVRVGIEIVDQDYFPLKQTKSLHVTFYDNFQTSLIFFIRRKQVLKSLKDASLQKVSHLLHKKKKGPDLESLELPKSLKGELLTESSSIWYHTQPSKLSDMKIIRRASGWRPLGFLVI